MYPAWLRRGLCDTPKVSHLGININTTASTWHLTAPHYPSLPCSYFLFGNCMIAFCFLLSSLFSSARTAVVVSFLYIFAAGLIAELMLKASTGLAAGAEYDVPLASGLLPP